MRGIAGQIIALNPEAKEISLRPFAGSGSISRKKHLPRKPIFHSTTYYCHEGIMFERAKRSLEGKIIQPFILLLAHWITKGFGR